MPSPFPGMNPYLEHEDAWHDFHQTFMTVAREFLAPLVEPQYFVKIEANIYIHERSSAERRLLGNADVALATRTPNSEGQAVATVTRPAPVRRTFPRVDVLRENYLEVRDRQTRRVVSVIELLSPSNKRAGEDRNSYLAKRQQLMRSETHFIEIDLLRGLPRMPHVDLPDHDYYTLVSRVELRPEVELWPINLRDRLPIIPIPLQSPHPDADLDLQAVLHRVYDSARYGNYIYTHDPQPALSREDAAWARSLIPPGG